MGVWYTVDTGKEGTLQCTSKHKAFLQKVGCINKCLNRLPSNQHGGVTLHIDVSVIGRNTTVMDDLLSLGNKRPSRKSRKQNSPFAYPKNLLHSKGKLFFRMGNKLG